MLSGRDFIIFSDDWGRHPSSCQHIVRHLLGGNRVIWVNTIGMRSPKFTAYDIKRSFEKIWSWVSGKDRPADGGENRNPVIVNPFIIPYNGVGAVRSLNRNTVVRKIKGVMDEHGVKEPIVLTTFPSTADYCGAFDEAAHIYYCVDDFTHWPGVDRKMVLSMEDELIAGCDLVLATSRELCSKKQRGGKVPVLLPHGVDFEHFSSSAERSVPPALGSIPGPVIGFFGAISPWLDFDLITAAAKARPSWSFVFIGPADTDIASLAACPNIHLLGSVPYGELPSYAKGFDVGIIPFLVNELTVSVNPLKLLEYLATGMPVVSTGLPEVREFSGVVSIADTVEDFIKGIEYSLSAECAGKKAERMNTARKHSWKSVAEDFSRAVEGLLSGARR
jgi:glycosyltransferase involved in cell wall biosynthesis